MRQTFKLIPAAYVVFRDGNSVLMLRRSNTGYRDGHYGFPAGHVDGGEPAIKAACREAKEEVGVEVEPDDLRLIHTMHNVSELEDTERVSFFFETRRWKGNFKNAEPDKHDKINWFPINELPKKVAPEVRQALEKIAHNESYSDLGF